MVNTKQGHRLVTHEDRSIMHMHKTLGIIVLCHMLYRLYLIYQYADSGLTRARIPLWMTIHAMLHVTSFQFHLYQKRNKVYNIIWPEFRLHSMIFAYRSIIAVLLSWYGGYWNHVLRGPLVLSTMAAADAVTMYYGQDTTMRGNPYADGTPKWFIIWHNRFYSVSQFGATMGILCRGINSAFLALLPIQTAPFFMTLAKKGIISQTEWHVLYTFTLLTNWVYALVCKGNDENIVTTATYMTILSLVTIARFGFRINKYILWGSAWFASQYMRTV